MPSTSCSWYFVLLGSVAKVAIGDNGNVAVKAETAGVVEHVRPKAVSSEGSWRLQLANVEISDLACAGLNLVSGSKDILDF